MPLIQGEWKAILREGGKVVREVSGKNLVVASGLAEMAKLLHATGAAGVRPRAVKVGTSTTAPASGQTGLVGSTLGSRVASIARSGNEVTYTATFTSGEAVGNIQELGLFTATGAGTLYGRALTGLIGKIADQRLTMIYKITFQG